MDENMYTPEYLAALAYVLEIEGKPSNYNWDPGGETVLGISREYWPQYWADGRPTMATARRFYWVEFWCKLHLPSITYQPLRLEIFDAAVNCGPANGPRFAQSAYNLLKPSDWPTLNVNGVMNAPTVAGLNRMANQYPDSLLGGCNYYQAHYYATRRDSLRSKAIRGWFAKRLCWVPK